MFSSPDTPNFLPFSRHTDSLLQLHTFTHAVFLPGLPFLSSCIHLLQPPFLFSLTNSHSVFETQISCQFLFESFLKLLQSILHLTKLIILKYFEFTSDITCYLVTHRFPLDLRFLKAKTCLVQFSTLRIQKYSGTVDSDNQSIIVQREPLCM